MARSENFKTYARSQRTQIVENTYNLGMQYTEKPITDGFSRVLVNYEVDTDGVSLTPRAGLRKTETTLTDVPSGSYLVHCGHTAPANKDEKLFAITGVLNSDESNLTERIHTASLTLHTTEETYEVPAPQEETQETEESQEEVEEVEETEETEEETQEVEESYSKNTVLCDGTVLKHEPHIIHDAYVTPDEVEGLFNPIGAFAFEQGYYFFGKDSTDNKYKLHQIKYDIDAEQNNNYKLIPVELENPSPSEAVVNGYNMLLEHPYSFEDKVSGSGVQLLGILPYKDEANTKLELYPVKNQKVCLRCYYSVGTSDNIQYRVRWFWKTVSSSQWSAVPIKFSSDSSWKDYDDVTFSNTYIATTQLKANINLPLKNVLVKVELSDITTGVIEHATTVNLDYSEQLDKSAVNKAPKEYDLTHAEGLAYWNNRLIIWGAPEDNTILFISDVNNPGYFPYPHNITSYQEPIVHVEPVSDMLLVFTTTQLHCVTYDVEYDSFTTKCIQRNLSISKDETHLVQGVKNMVFFKSGNYYYMVVPSKTRTSELSIAPISKNIEQFLDNFSDSVDNVLKLCYNNCYRNKKLIHHYSTLDYENIVCTYLYKLAETYLNFCLVYNSISRIWRIEVYETEHILNAVKADATKRSTYCMLFPNTNDGTELAFFEYNKNNLTDDLLTAEHKQTSIYKNNQCLDTGYREFTSTLKKRYREIQFTVYNTSQNPIKFNTGFYIDGSTRLETHEYELTETVENGIRTVALTPKLTDGYLIEGLTALGSWELGVSKFPEIATTKVRIPVSGKGYMPRMILISNSEQKYKLLNNVCIYRLLYSR